MNGQWAVLVRRELWEHRALWIAPVVVAGLALLGASAGALMADGSFQFRGPARFDRYGASAADIGLFGLAFQMFGVAAIVCGFYLLDCLYAERKDRSILFWKSLPVSDRDTVLAKLAVALLIVPLGVFVLTSLVYPVSYAILAAGMPQFSALTGGWSFEAWLRSEAALLGTLGLNMLWFLPVATWAMLASVLSRRSPIVLATVPVVILGVCEGVMLQTGEVWRFVGRRLMPRLDAAEALVEPALWLGLVAAAGMLYWVVRLRRYRDDT